MHLLYLDATGSTDLSDRNSSHYLLLGVCVQDGRARTELEAALLTIAKRYQLDDPIELHAKDICVSIREQEAVPDLVALSPAERRNRTWAIMEAKLLKLTGEERRHYKVHMRSKRPILHLLRRERSSLYEEVLDAIGALRGVRLFLDAAEKRQVLKKYGPKKASEIAFNHVVGRFVGYLQRVSADERRRARGRLLMDNDPKDEQLFRELHATYCREGHQLGQVQDRIGHPSFVDSRQSLGIQAADICAYAARRYIEHWDKVGKDGVKHEEKQFLRIWHLVDRDNGKLHGARHFIRPDRCGCMICVGRLGRLATTPHRMDFIDQ